MNRFRQSWQLIQSQLGGLTGSQKLLAGCLVVIAAMTLFLVGQYAGNQPMIGLINEDPNINLVQTLRGAGIDAKVEGDSIVVPPSQQRRAVATLAQAGQLPGDTTILFSNLMQFQDWKNPRQQNRQQYLLALQNELGRVITLYPNIASAQVFIDAPEPTGLGRASRSPTASVSVFTVDQAGLPQSGVDAIARLVSGPVSGLVPASVEVIDPTGPRRVTSDDDLLSTSWLEHSQKVERATESKLRTLLAGIPGVVVSVTAQVDITRVTESSRQHLKNNEGSIALPRSETIDESVDSQASRGAEPGVRSNQQADIAQAGGSGTSSTRTQNTTEFDTAIGVNERQVYDPRGMPTYISASVAIPQSWVEQLLLQERARAASGDAEEDAAPLTEAEIQGKFDAIKPQYEAMLAPQLVAVGDDGARIPGELSVNMIQSVGSVVSAGAGQQASFFGSMQNVAGQGGGGVPLGPLGSISIETLMVGVLAAVSLIMMLMMVRRSGKQVDLPDAAEIVGIPPQLKTPDNIVGEAGETETAMEGIEVDETQMKVQKMLDQVNELVGDNPVVASRLLGRWIDTN